MSEEKDTFKEKVWKLANRLHYLLSSSNKRKLLAIKNKHKGEKCFIIGNGPSLTIEDLNKIKNEQVMVANSIIRIFSDLSYIPPYYFSQDPIVIKDNYTSIENQKGCTKFIRSFYSKRYQFSNSTYFNLIDSSIDFSNDISKKIYCGWSVTYSMIQFAAYMGFTEIYLLGVDFNYAKNNTEINTDCYFDKRLFNKNVKYALPKTAITLAAFSKAKEYAEKNGVKIYNATRGGKLEVFNRVDFDNLKFK